MKDDIIFKKIKERLATSTVDSEIIGEPDYSKLKDDLIPLSSIFSVRDDVPFDSISQKIAQHLESVGNTYDRDDRYDRYATALKNSEIEGAMEIYASETCTPNENGETINIFSSSEKVVNTIKELFDRIGIYDKDYSIVKNICSFGDEFYENIFSKDGKKILNINKIPRSFIARKEKNGTLQYFYIRKNKDMKNAEDSSYVFDYSGSRGSSNNKIEEIDPIRILHWRVTDDMYSPYGRSILDSVIGPIEELKLMENALVISRITRAPERRIYNVNVGNAAGEKGIAIAREIVSRTKQKSILNKSNSRGGVDKNYDFFGQSEDVILPFRPGEEKSTIDTLPQLNAVSDLADLEFIRDRIFPGLGIPRQYLFDDTFANANTNLSNKSIQFAKRIRRIQKAFIFNLYKLAYIQLRMAGISPKEYSDLVITMNNPSNVDQKEKIETDTALWTLISSIKATNTEKIFYNDFYLYKNILNLNNDEILDLMIQNIAQETARNPFSFVDETSRPDNWTMIDQLKPEGGADVAGGEEIEGEGGELPPEAEEAFGGPGEGGGGEGEAGEEGEGGGGEAEAEVASVRHTGLNGKEALLEALVRARKYTEKKKKELKPYEEKKQTYHPYNESFFKLSGDLKGIKAVEPSKDIIAESKKKKYKKLKKNFSQ